MVEILFNGARFPPAWIASAFVPCNELFRTCLAFHHPSSKCQIYTMPPINSSSVTNRPLAIVLAPIASTVNQVVESDHFLETRLRELGSVVRRRMGLSSLSCTVNSSVILSICISSSSLAHSTSRLHRWTMSLSIVKVDSDGAAKQKYLL